MFSPDWTSETVRDLTDSAPDDSGVTCAASPNETDDVGQKHRIHTRNKQSK